MKIESLHKIFDQSNKQGIENHVLRGIDLEMEAGNFFALMGPSGSGKSTLLNIVGGLTEPTGGTVKVNGEELGELNDKKLTTLRGNEIGWIFQSFALVENLTALENVMIPLDLQGVKDDEAEKIARSLLDKVGLGDRKLHFPSDLSGGQQQRVAIARSLANSPKLLLADEPTGNLDTSTGLSIIELFKELATEGKAILMVTHDTKLAHAAEKVFIMRQGIVKAEAELSEKVEV